jgi:hypothetical protein
MKSRLAKSWIRSVGVLCVLWIGCGGGEEAAGGTDAVPNIQLPDMGKADGYGPITRPEDCPGGAPLLPNGKPATWTILHYAAADNNLESVLLQDINEMEAGHRGTASVNIVVQLDKYSEPGVWRYHVKPDSDRTTINSTLVGHSEEEPNSGDWRTLAAFGQWATTCYPADYYAVVIGGHGSGWSGSEGDARSASILADAQAEGEVARSIAPDDSHGTSMYIEELRRALTEIRQTSKRAGDPDWLNRMVLYGSDACLMATFEVTYDLRNTATYVVGSEETEPGEGWPYNTIIRDLTERPSYYAQRPHEFAKSIVRFYKASYGPSGSAKRVKDITLSAVDASAALRAKNAFEKITTALFELSQENEAIGEALWGARERTYNFHGFVDMALLFRSLQAILLEQELIPRPGQHWSGDPRARDLAQSMESLLTDIWPELVLEVARGESYPDAAGLSLYFPTDLCGGWSGGPKIDVYATSSIGQATQWDELIVQLVTKRGGVNLTYTAKGSATLEAPGFPVVENLPVDCRFAWGQLTLRGSDDRSNFSATMDRKEEGLSLSRASWSIVTESGTQWIDLPWGAEALPMQGTFEPDQAYQVERVELPLQSTDHETGETREVPTVLSFSCPTPAMKYCN